MNTERNEVLDALKRIVDGPMRQVGFSRALQGLTFRRGLPESEQEIGLDFHRRPRHHPSARLQLAFGYRILMPVLEAEFRALGFAEPADLPTISGSYEMLMPKPVPMFYVEAGLPADAAFVALRDRLLDHAVPFFDQLTRPADLVLYYERRRAGRPSSWRGADEFTGDYTYARVAFAAIRSGRMDVAALIARTDLAGRSARETYARLLEVIDQDAADT